MNDLFPQQYKYTLKRVSELNEYELQDLTQKVSQGYTLCPICRGWVLPDQIRRIPERYKIKNRLGLNLSYSDLEFLEPDEACIYCISGFASQLRHREEWLLEQQRVFNSADICTQKAKKYGKALFLTRACPPDSQEGFTYILRCNDIHKIGKTIFGVRGRLSAFKSQIRQKWPIDFIHAISSSKPAFLEWFLHQKFADKWLGGEESRLLGINSNEIFRLNDADLDYIKSLQTIDGELVRHYCEMP